MHARDFVRVGRRSSIGRVVASLVLAAIAASGLVAVTSISAVALDGSQFQAGYIISDANFYNSNAMTQAQIQSFLEAHEPGACGDAGCLKSYTTTTTSHPQLKSDTTGNVRCNAYAGGGVETAAAIIFKVQQACGISAKVILVTLQKEESLVTATSASPANLTVAMGYACPDHTGNTCDTTYYGFFNQVYWGALQMNTYRASNFGTYKPGPAQIAYSPESYCGAKAVNIQNYGTAALYNYTPYTPSDAALANLRGSALTGDPNCSTYGNRNFWVFYNDYFGSPTGGISGSLQTVVAANNSVNVSGWAVDGDNLSSAATLIISGQGWSFAIGARASSSASLGAFPTAGSNHGFVATLRASVGQQDVCATGVAPNGVLSALGCITVTVPSALPTPTQISGTDRFDTAVKISQQTAPGVPVVYVASGENFPDALSVAATAAHKGVPLLLVRAVSVPPEVQTELTRLRPASIVVIGGTTAVSPAVQSQLSAVAPVTRIGGATRYDTSIQVGAVLGVDHGGTAYIATAQDFPDALSSASAAGVQDAPLLLVDGSAASVAPDLSNALQQWGVTHVTLVGGTTAITPQFETAVRAVPGISSVTRVGGADRYATSEAVNAAAFPTPTSGAFFATGLNFPDGLSGGALAGTQKKPLYLVPGTCVPASTFDQLTHAGAVPVTLIGGTDALTPSIKAFTPCP